MKVYKLGLEVKVLDTTGQGLDQKTIYVALQFELADFKL